MTDFTTGGHDLILNRIRDIPSLPEVVDKLLLILNQSNTPASEVARLIAYDPGLTSKVLRMVNAAAFGFQRQISSIQHAVMILGFTTVRGLVLSASIFKLLEGQSYPGGLNHEQFWKHSMSTAVAARMLADALNIPEVDDVFSAAMLHDIGKVALDVYFSKDYAPILALARANNLPMHGLIFISLEKKIMGITHSDIGNAIAAKWKLPTTITEVITCHHYPESAVHCPALVHLVALADEMAVVQQEHEGIFRQEAFTPGLLEYFNLTPEALEAFQRQLNEEMVNAHDLLDAM